MTLAFLEQLVRPRRWMLAGALLGMLPWPNVWAGPGEPPKVIASILPIHALLAGVMAGVGEPTLLIPGEISPHQFALKPSDTRAIHQARILFWLGPEMETVLIRPFQTLDPAVVRIELLRQPELHPIPYQENPLVAPEEAHQAEESGHHHHGMDPHIWLDPTRAQTLVAIMAREMAKLDPDHQGIYADNQGKIQAKLHHLDQEIAAITSRIAKRPFLVMHDAYRYFVRRYQLEGSYLGAVMDSPDHPPGAKRMTILREAIRKQQVACLFSEPHFSTKIAATVIEGSTTKSGILNPEGAGLAKGPDSFFIILRQMTATMAQCLGE